MALLLNDDLPLKKITLAEFDTLPADERNTYELIDNTVMMTPRPTINHQLVCGNIYAKLHTFFAGKKCQAVSEIEIKLNDDIFVPDISILCDPKQFSNARFDGAPTIAIEILSPSTARVDLFTKLYKYQIAGIKEYWIVNTKAQSVTIHNFEKETVTEFFTEDTLISPIFEGLEIILKDIF